MEKIRSLNDAWKGYLKTRGLEPPTAAKGQQKCLDKAMLVCVFLGGEEDGMVLVGGFWAPNLL